MKRNLLKSISCFVVVFTLIFNAITINADIGIYKYKSYIPTPFALTDDYMYFLTIYNGEIPVGLYRYNRNTIEEKEIYNFNFYENSFSILTDKDKVGVLSEHNHIYFTKIIGDGLAKRKVILKDSLIYDAFTSNGKIFFLYTTIKNPRERIFGSVDIDGNYEEIAKISLNELGREYRSSIGGYGDNVYLFVHDGKDGRIYSYKSNEFKELTTMNANLYRICGDDEYVYAVADTDIDTKFKDYLLVYDIKNDKMFKNHLPSYIKPWGLYRSSDNFIIRSRSSIYNIKDFGQRYEKIRNMNFKDAILSNGDDLYLYEKNYRSKTFSLEVLK